MSKLDSKETVFFQEIGAKIFISLLEERKESVTII